MCGVCGAWVFFLFFKSVFSFFQFQVSSFFFRFGREKNLKLTLEAPNMNFHLCLSISINSLWEALNVKASSPNKFMDVTSVKVSDKDGFLSRSMMIKARNTVMKERIRINRVANEIVFHPCIQTMALSYTMSV